MNRYPSFSALNPTVFRLLLPAVALLFTACEKTIDLKLKDASPRTVIEGNLSDGPGPYQVSVTRTVSYNDPNVFPAVANAFVTISDNAGSTDTLTETTPGIYQTQKIQGVPGRTYFLTVNTGDEQFAATSFMPAAVPAIELTVEKTQFGNRLFPRVKFQDPAGVPNYYRLLLTVNDTLSKNLFVLDDKYVDGRLVDDYLFDRSFNLKSGDVVQVALRSIDENVLRYLREESQLGNAQAASPANPTSNISNGALGYFSAHPETSATVTVP